MEKDEAKTEEVNVIDEFKDDANDQSDAENSNSDEKQISVHSEDIKSKLSISQIFLLCHSNLVLKFGLCIDELTIDEDQFDSLSKDVKRFEKQSGKLGYEIKKLKAEETRLKESLEHCLKVSNRKRKRESSNEKEYFDHADNQNNNDNQENDEQESSKYQKLEVEEREYKRTKHDEEESSPETKKPQATGKLSKLEEKLQRLNGKISM